MEINLHEALRVRVDVQDPLALIVGDSDNKHTKHVATAIGMYDWRYGIFDSSRRYKDVVYNSMHTLLMNIDLVVVVLTDEPRTDSAIDTGYILGIASTPAYACPVLVYNAINVDNWPFILHTVDTTIERIEDVAVLMDILEMKKGIVDFSTRLRAALQILKSAR